MNGQIAYDEEYHKGINIIRGDNSSGKSTITHFIFYVLGGAFNDWVKEAKKCQSVTAEVELNGAVVTIKRNIVLNELGKANDKEGIYFFWGSYQKSLTQNDSWQKFNFNTTTERKSFSNVLFENLDLPIVKGENNITFHQVLRLLYLDQESPTSSLFYYEPFDSSLTRETVSDLLLGVYNQELYDKQQREIEADREYDDVRKEIKIIKQFITNPLDLVPSNVVTAIDNKEKEVSEIEEQIIGLREESKRLRYTQKTQLEFEVLNTESIGQREKVNRLKKEIASFRYEIEDTNFFIEALENKRNAIKKSIKTRDLLGEFPLEYCPECLSDLSNHEEEEDRCKLCKQKIDQTFGISQARKIEQELSFQIKESRTLVIKKERQLIDIEANYDAEQVKFHQLQRRVNQALGDVRSHREEKLDSLYVEKGFVEGEIVQLRTLLENAEIYQKLVNREAELKSELEVLSRTISTLKNNRERLKSDINRAIEKKGTYLLNNDLRRQSDFYEAKEFHIDYGNNIAFISDKDAKYSASSSFYLKASARFSIFLASLEIPNMRYPRFIFSDNMEDKGIEEERAQNFQRIIIAESEKFNKDDYQVIYTTSFIPNELNNTAYCVGDYYTESNPSLKNV
ncbi:AAA family ATPase [Marinoscillum sp. 108]|uniref:AAA family ATPase n=1 Tax=Marinoscillum sp. 108 TaxID=2653151 RepID=UPI001C870205|nr:AAA family ATPase [Marinoscillum sp. 108]